jgi:type II secretory pathway pseudopilin PulG
MEVVVVVVVVVTMVAVAVAVAAASRAASRTRSEQWRAATPQSRALSSVQSAQGQNPPDNLAWASASASGQESEVERAMERWGNGACARARPESGRRTWGLILTERGPR